MMTLLGRWIFGMAFALFGNNCFQFFVSQFIVFRD
jgi:hypothetical protein